MDKICFSDGLTCFVNAGIYLSREIYSGTLIMISLFGRSGDVTACTARIIMGEKYEISHNENIEELEKAWGAKYKILSKKFSIEKKSFTQKLIFDENYVPKRDGEDKGAKIVLGGNADIMDFISAQTTIPIPIDSEEDMGLFIEEIKEEGSIVDLKTIGIKANAYQIGRIDDGFILDKFNLKISKEGEC